MAIERPIDPDAVLFTGVANRLALAFAVLVTDQTLTSEGDMPFEPFTAPFAAARVTATTLRDVLGLDASRDVVLGPGGEFFAAVRASAEEDGDRRRVEVHAVLERTMSRTLGRLHRAFLRGPGVVEVPFLLFGRLAGGPLVGLRSTAIET